VILLYNQDYINKTKHQPFLISIFHLKGKNIETVDDPLLFHGLVSHIFYFTALTIIGVLPYRFSF